MPHIVRRGDILLPHIVRTRPIQFPLPNPNKHHLLIFSDRSESNIIPVGFVCSNFSPLLS